MNNSVSKIEPKPSSPSGLQHSSRRYLSLWFPYLPFERFRSTKPHDLPAVLVEKQRGALRLVACDAQARIAGLSVGMTLASARAIVPEIDVGSSDLAADQAALLKLAHFCERFTPLLALDGADGLLLDMTGCAHLFGGEAQMQAHIAQRLTRKGLSMRHALAGTPDCAHALARFSTTTYVKPGDEAQAVAKLPVKALEAGPETTVALTRAGLRTLGDLASRQSLILTSRFGSRLTSKLARILGHEDLRLTPLRPAPELVVENLFAEPLQNLFIVEAALAVLAEQICAQLEALGKGGRSFEICFFRADGAMRRLVIETALATREAAALVRLFALRLETLADPLEAGFGFDLIRLGVLRSEAVGQGQTQLDGKVESAVQEAELLNRLTIRFGAAQVLRFTAHDSHDPLRSAAAVPISTANAHTPWVAGADSLPRPLQLFTPPQPIEVMAEVPDGPPFQFRWRKILHQVRAAEGPERIESEWWRESSKLPRDYYRVESRDGARFWIFREGLFTSVEPRPRWFLHGLFA